MRTSGVRIFSLVLVNVDPFHSNPLGLVLTSNADHLHLPVNGPPKRTPRDTEVHARVYVPEANAWVLPPAFSGADDFPVITTVSFALFVAVARDLLISGQRTREMMRVQVLVCGDVVQPNNGSTSNWLAPITEFARLALNRPMTIDIVLQFSGRDWLLSGSWAILDVMWMQTNFVGLVQQLYHGTACNMLAMGA